MSIARSLCRITIGGLFIGHGAQKLFGWFGGSGLDGTEKLMASLDVKPPRQSALAAGVTEAGAGAMLTLGLGTPLAASALIGTMTTAIRKAHWSKGLWNYNGGYEYNLVLIAALTALTESGPGRPSLDEGLHLDLRGTRWAIGALSMGIAGSAAATAIGDRVSARQQHDVDDADVRNVAEGADV